MAESYAGGCHCGAIRVAFETLRPLSPRACQCSFCRKHGARSVSDPEGRAAVSFSLESQRYRFASRAADYLICATCGVYVGALATIDGTEYATLNLNAFDDPNPSLEAMPVTYDGETAASKMERRRERWTPVRR